MKNTLNFKKLEPHPLGSIFPPMDDESYARLIQSLKNNGYDSRQPIILYEGKILDGNNRYTACKSVRGCEPTFKEFDGEDPIAFVIEMNLARRHLTPSQAAALGAELVEMMEKAEQAAKEAAKALAKENGSNPSKRSKGVKAKKAAAMVGSSERNVSKARALKGADPEEFEKVRSGSKRLNTATKDAEKKKSAAEKQGEQFAAAKVRIVEMAGEDFALAAEKKLRAKDFITLSGLEKEEVLRAQPLIEAGWSVKAALGYKSTQFTPTHPVRALIDRCIAQHGNLTVEFAAYGQEFTVTVTRK